MVGVGEITSFEKPVQMKVNFSVQWMMKDEINVGKLKKQVQHSTSKETRGSISVTT